LTQSHLDKFEMFSPALPLFARKRRQEMILSRRGQASSHDVCASATRPGRTQDAMS
jgi:hypothetical protein